MDWPQLLNTVGFPTFVAIVLLWRVYDMHAENLRAIAALTQAIEALRLCVRASHFIPGGDKP